MTETLIEPDYDELSDESPDERAAREELEVRLDEKSKAFVDFLVKKILIVVDTISENNLYGYQVPFAYRIIESLILQDGATLTALFSRQSGKTETVANTIVACMIMFPLLSRVYPQWFGRFRQHGLRIGAFAPVDDQADNLFSRMVDCLTSERALEFLSDPDIQDEPTSGRGKMIQLKKLKSFIRKQTAHPRASIEGRTYDLILIDECQGADEKVVNKSINPMGTSTRATKVWTGTPTYTKGVFYRQIQFNKREATKPRGKKNHFEADWKEAAKWNKNYGKSVKDEMLKIGEDSDEFKLSYRLMWLLDKGMFTSSERIAALGDLSMPVQQAWSRSPCVVGIDPARKQDSTIVTVVWVDWDHPDENGYYEHRVLNWLDLTGVDWEEQYFRIVEFLSNYNVLQAAVDEGGMGDVVVDRLRRLMPNIAWVPINSQRPEQSKRWKHLGELLRRGRIGWPAHAKTRQLRTWKRFTQQMEELELKFEGPYVLAQAPNETGAHDDYADSLALACVLTKDFTMPEIEVSGNLFYA